MAHMLPHFLSCFRPPFMQGLSKLTVCASRKSQLQHEILAQGLEMLHNMSRSVRVCQYQAQMTARRLPRAVDHLTEAWR